MIIACYRYNFLYTQHDDGFQKYQSEVQKRLGGPPTFFVENRFVATSNFGQRALSIVWFGDILWLSHMGSIKNPATQNTWPLFWPFGQ